MCVRLQNLHESTPIEMANTIAVPIATAVRVEVRVEVRAPAARTAAPYTSTVPSTAMCLCVRLQNTHEDPAPVRSEAKYTEKARKTLLAQAMHGVEPTKKELNKLKQQYFRKDYNAWLKRQERAAKRAAKRRVRDEEDEAVLAGIVAELGARAGAELGAELGFESFGTLVRTLIQVEPPVRTLIQVEPRTSVDPRLRPCGADNNSEQLSSPLPALLSPSVLSSPAPALGPLPSTLSRAAFTPSSLSSLFGDRS